MKRILFSLLMLLGQTGLQSAEASLHVADPGQLLAAESAWRNSCEKQLISYERTSGINIIVEFHLKSPSEEEDKKPGVYMHALARKLGIDRGGVLVVYFHDDPDWRVWIGDDLTKAFTGKPGTVQELTANEAIHNAKEAMLTAARTKADAQIELIKKASKDGQAPSVAQQLIIQADVLLDSLKTKVAPK